MEQAKLTTILDEHKKWSTSCGQKGSQADLQGADLQGADLIGANLQDADLRGADLRGADLRCADLRCADFQDADLSDAELRFAYLQYADLRDANLYGADLRYADLRYADLRGADLRYANLRGANLIGADLDFPCFPLWCGGLDVHIDDKQATQLLYHLIRNVKFSKNTSKALKQIFQTESLITQANKFHRVNECGKIEECDTDWLERGVKK